MGDEILLISCLGFAKVTHWLYIIRHTDNEISRYRLETTISMKDHTPQVNTQKETLTTRQEITEQGFFDYASWLSSLKQRIRETQLRAAIVVNTELVRMYWQIGHEILKRQQQQG